MPPSSSRRMSTTPYLPGAWPVSFQDNDQHDDTQDADVSSVSSYGSVIVRARKDSDRRARRRWTYAGQPRSTSRSIGPISPVLRTSGDVEMSPLTEVTVSTAVSSALNTPDMADWPTHLGAHSASHSLLLENIAYPSATPTVTRFVKDSPSQSPSGHRSRLLSSASRDNRFLSPHLDPPLLSFIPGLPPLRLPLSDISGDFPYLDSPPHPPSPPSETCSTPPSFNIPSPRFEQGGNLEDMGIFGPSAMALDFFPVAEMPEPSPHLTVSSPSESQVSHTDSPVLPPISGDITSDVDYMHLAPPISDMDAFALAAAVASSNSRSSFSIPPSIHSTAALHSTVAPPIAQEVSSTIVRPHSHRLHSDAVASVDDSYHESATGYLAIPQEPKGQSRIRRLSAPSPSIWRAPRPQTARIISSRVDVGRESVASQREKQLKPPVLGKVKKLGERIRGLFKSKGESAPRGDSMCTRTPPEYGLMTTTTAVTNVEYESEHPIPLPSPRARIMRNHRRSLPIQSLLPLNIDYSRATQSGAPERDGVSHPPSENHSSSDPSRSDETQQVTLRGSDLARSPHTPKPKRERTRTAPQTTESEPKASERKARRFSLSSALTKSKIDSLRSTVKPRPPLPKYISPGRMECAVPSASTNRGLSSASEIGSAPSTVGQHHELIFETVEQPFWGGELPNPTGTQDTPQPSISLVDTPARSRTETAQSHHSIVPSTPKDKRSRRFSLSSLMAKRSLRPMEVAWGQEETSPSGVKQRRRFSRRRPRGDTVTTVTHETSRSEREPPKASLDVPPVPDLPSSNRSSLASSSVESTYYDAREQLSEPEHDLTLVVTRSYSPRPESDLDSMSFARTPDYSSGTFSIGSSTEREYYHELSDLSVSSPYTSRGHATGRMTGSNAISHLVGEGSETPITKTLRFSPTLSLAFDMSCSDLGDDDALHRLEREEDLSFMRALGFEFDEIARRVREEPF